MKHVRTMLCGVLLIAGCGAAHGGSITALWANDGGDKVTRDELRASRGERVTNHAWDGGTIRVFGARNEVVSFNLVLEASGTAATGVSVTMTDLRGPGGSVIRYAPRARSGLFDWSSTEIELFYVRYMQAAGISFGSFEAGGVFAEPTWPARFQCPPPLAKGCAWTERPGANKYFPDIAVPLELVPAFTVGPAGNQSVWADIYIPKAAASGVYSGSLTMRTAAGAVHVVPVSLTVRRFTLPDTPSAKTMINTTIEDIAPRYAGVRYPVSGTVGDLAAKQALTNEFVLAHRHKLSLIDDNFGVGWSWFRPTSRWLGILNGSQFTAANGYAGPGAAVGQDVFSIGTYGNILTGTKTEAAFDYALDRWGQWFQSNSPGTERFVYVCDEAACTGGNPTLTTYLQWWEAGSASARSLHTLATQPLGRAPKSLSVPASTLGFATAAVSTYQSWVDEVHAAEPARHLYQYNGARPAAGTTSIEDDGVALRVLPWAQYKKGVDRWFMWESTYYWDYLNGRGNVDVWRNPVTFGCPPRYDAQYGMISGCARFAIESYGDGVLFYPGTDQLFPADSYGVDGPIASLRLKHWRRGIQDVDYLTLAKKINPAAVAQIVNRMVPRVLWEVPCTTVTDCTYTSASASWSTNPDDWETARAELAHIIDGL
ncbi:MAG: hypothetical protein PVSMB6_16760 [Steroidobacteraceae bacterium]